MEDLRRIQVNNMASRINRSSKTKTRKKTKTNSKALVKLSVLIASSLSIVITLVLLISNLSLMVSLSSNNKLAEYKLADLEIELNYMENLYNENNSLKKVEKIATSRLDMVYPNNDSIVVVNKDHTQKVVDGNTTNEEIAKNEKNLSIINQIGNFFR